MLKKLGVMGEGWGAGERGGAGVHFLWEQMAMTLRQKLNGSHIK